MHNNAPSPLMTRWIRRIGIAISIACLAFVGVRALTVPSPPAGRPATPEERAEIAKEFARLEPVWRNNAKHKFPGDHWSQDDDFHCQEMAHARRVAANRNIRLSDVFMAIDEGLRQEYPGKPFRRPSARPCKPRAFYD